MPYKDPAKERARNVRRREEKRLYMQKYSPLHRERERARCKKWCRDNPERKATYDKAYAKAHPEKNKAAVQKYLAKKRAEPAYRSLQAEKARKWRSANREQSNRYNREYAKRRRETDLNFAILEKLRARLYKKVTSKGIRKAGSTTDLTGCSPDFLRGYLEARFLPGMTWKNRDKWHIDHHVPCAEFDLRDPVQQRQCFHFSNLKPLWSADNLSKGAKHPGAHQAELLLCHSED